MKHFTASTYSLNARCLHLEKTVDFEESQCHTNVDKFLAQHFRLNCQDVIANVIESKLICVFSNVLGNLIRWPNTRNESYLIWPLLAPFLPQCCSNPVLIRNRYTIVDQAIGNQTPQSCRQSRSLSKLRIGLRVFRSAQFAA